MKNKTIILQASSRSKGDTHTIIQHLNATKKFDVIDLKNKNIGHFDYDFKNVDDDFIGLMRNVLDNYNTIVFVTPVYWYSMSGILKVFFDRLSDLLKISKELGRKLRNKNMALISCSNSDDLVQRFNIPFIESAHYLGMNYLVDMHTWVENDTIPEEVKINIDKFRIKIS